MKNVSHHSCIEGITYVGVNVSKCLPVDVLPGLRSILEFRSQDPSFFYFLSLSRFFVEGIPDCLAETKVRCKLR